MSVYEPIFEILNAAGARYVVVGGVATLLHGYARLTADVDLAVDLAPQEALKMIRALIGKGFRPQAPVSGEMFADPAVREEWLQEKHMRAFSLVDPKNPMRVVDLLLKPEVPFEELLARSQEALVGETSVRVASLDDLITLKRHAGRPQDWTDIKELEAIRNRKRDR